MKDDFLDTEKDQLKLQVAARAKLLDENKPPSLSVRFCDPGPRDETTGILGSPEEVDSKFARMSGGDLAGQREYDRKPNESLEQFKRRVSDDLPAIGPPRLVVFFEVREQGEQIH